jgi:hypothetical protein
MSPRQAFARNMAPGGRLGKLRCGQSADSMKA